MENIFKGQNVLVTGATGMIGRSLTKLLLEKGAIVTSASLDTNSIPNVYCHNIDLTVLKNCLHVCTGQDYVFHLAGIKGSPKMAAEKPASFAFPMILFNTNMLEAARQCNVKWYLYTSSVGVYNPVEVLKEEDVWLSFPSPFDKFAGWSKRMGELQVEAYNIQYNMNNISIVRPANVYGINDTFNEHTSMVVSALIKRVITNKEKPLKVWGDGSAIRDFIYTDDVAQNMIKCVENGVTEPVNLGSGEERTIKDVAELVVKYSGLDVKIEWDTTKLTGDAKRVMDITRMQKYGLSAPTSLEEGIRKTIEWYKGTEHNLSERYDPFE